MTVQEFKELQPQLAHLEGDALWNAMEDYMLLNNQHSMPNPRMVESVEPLMGYRFLIFDVTDKTKEDD